MRFVSRSLLLLFFGFFGLFGYAQIIDNRYGTAFTEDSFFNVDFIRQNKIKSITGSVATKREGEAVRQRDQFFYYEFDSLGRISVIMSTFSALGLSTDTTVTRFYYDAQHNLITRRSNDNHGFYSYNYEYDSLGRITRESYCRDENAGPDKYHFIQGQQFVISSETFSYETYSKHQRVKRYYNNYGQLYQEKFSYFNELGYHTEDILRLTLSGKESKMVYGYDDKGRLNRKSDISYLMGYNEITHTYVYDTFGNLEEENVFRNEKQSTLRSLLYDKNTLLLNAQVMKDFHTELIYIFKYSYSFYR